MHGARSVSSCQKYRWRSPDHRIVVLRWTQVVVAAAVAVAVVVTAIFTFMVSRTSMPKHPQSPKHPCSSQNNVHAFFNVFTQFLLFFQLPEHPCPNHKNSPPRAHTVTKASMPKPEIFSLSNESSYQRDPCSNKNRKLSCQI